MIEVGLIPKGEVDERDIKEVSPNDLKGFSQCHFFAGVGGWPYALRLAGWPEDRPVWSGSCPCQPFSMAGKRKGVEDQRHLWPAFRWLIAKCRPSTVFGEQVAGKDGLKWLAGIRFDLETMGYAVGVADLCAAGVGAPHIRQRLFWVADTELARREKTGARHEVYTRNESKPRRGGLVVGMADTVRSGWTAWRPESGDGSLTRDGELCRMGQSDSSRPWSGSETPKTAGYRNSIEPTGFWSESRLVKCADGKLRRIPLELALFPLAHGVPGRVGLLKGAGNAIVPQVAAQFIKAYLER